MHEACPSALALCRDSHKQAFLSGLLGKHKQASYDEQQGAQAKAEALLNMERLAVEAAGGVKVRVGKDAVVEEADTCRPRARVSSPADFMQQMASVLPPQKCSQLAHHVMLQPRLPLSSQLQL